MTDTSKLDLFDGTGIAGGEDGTGEAPGHLYLDGLDWPDPISEEVGRTGYLANHVVGECLLNVEDDEGLVRSEPAEFDRYYFPEDGGELVLVDILPGGSEIECAAQEAEKRVALKREWCEARGVTYKVVTEMLSPIVI